MMRFKKETSILVIALAIAILGLLQLFHEEAYANPSCSFNFCGCGDICPLGGCPPPSTNCACNGIQTNCGQWLYHGCTCDW